MANDNPFNLRDIDDEDKKNPKEGLFFEFDCPDCNAHNPYHDGFAAGSEVLCFYCGNTYKVIGLGERRIKLKEA